VRSCNRKLRVEHAGDGCRSHGCSDHRAAAQCPASRAGFTRQFSLAAFALAKVLRLDDPVGVGLLLGCAAGAPFLPKLAELAKGNLALAIGAMVLLMVGTVGYLPIVLPLLVPGVAVDPSKIARPLVLLMLLPLAAGLALKARYEDLTARVKPVLDWISKVSLSILTSQRTSARFWKYSARGASSRDFSLSVGLRDRLVALRTRQPYEADHGAWYQPAEHFPVTRTISRTEDTR
jgi:hypothetical protein